MREARPRSASAAPVGPAAGGSPSSSRPRPRQHARATPRDACAHDAQALGAHAIVTNTRVHPTSSGSGSPRGATARRTAGGSTGAPPARATSTAGSCSELAASRLDAARQQQREHEPQRRSTPCHHEHGRVAERVPPPRRVPVVEHARDRGCGTARAPNTDPTALPGKKSLGSVCRLFTHAWKPQQHRRPSRRQRGVQGSARAPRRCPAGVSSAPAVITVLRARSTDHPRRIRCPDAHPRPSRPRPRPGTEPRGPADLLQAEPARLLEIAGHPEHVEPPDRISDEAVRPPPPTPAGTRQQLRPIRAARPARARTAVVVRSDAMSARSSSVIQGWLSGAVVRSEPQGQPAEAQRARDQEGRAPPGTRTRATR